ncbi:MAG: cytochrome c oxidase accessory protein CcoG [Sphingomonadales bacterium]
MNSEPENNLEELAKQAANELSVAPVKNTEAVNSAEKRPLYASRQKVYPKRIAGTFRRLKWVFMSVALAIYYFTPWIRWDRGADVPNQAVLLDFPNRKFYFFWIEIWPHEIYYLTGLLILAALALFLVTSLAGRVWCGYSCPQTVWTDLFVHVERWIEGDRNKRMKLDKAPWSASKVFKKISKHSIWLLISAATGGAWIFYFADAPQLAQDLFVLEAPKPAYVFLVMFTGFTYVLGGLAREQVCTYMCPWPRIQGAMFDDDALLVTYRKYRGEPRGPHKKGETWDGRGDCVDCKLCVAVCPVGIDIRDGPQLECIQCALCVDACNSVMKQVGRPGNLIAYESFNNFERRSRGETGKLRLIRPRTVLYSSLIAIVGLIMLASLGTRSNLDVTVQKDRNPLFVTLSDGSVRNGYTLKILNKAHEPRTFSIDVEGLEGEVMTLGLGEQGNMVTAQPDSVKAVRLFLALPQDKLNQLDRGNADISIRIDNGSPDGRAEVDTKFKGPRR